MFALRVLMLWFALGICAASATNAADLNLLFLGDQGHHQPAKRARQLIPVLAERGIQIQYTEDIAEALTPSKLAEFDGLIVYANIDRIENAQAQALLQYVAEGHGFIPLHCASYCFRNNDDIVSLIGAQFQRHGIGTFRVRPAKEFANHPIMNGYDGFESWDETYVHTKHNEKNRTVLEYRVEGTELEPWTWIRTHGDGRVFYTAWGHGPETWGHEGFQNLVERGIRWACDDDPAKAGSYLDASAFRVPAMTEPRPDVAPVEFVDVGPEIPNYTRGNRWGTQGAPMTKMQKPLAAGESIKHFVTPVDFEMQLFADETILDSKPIAMNWDERGRLWVCQTYDYPNELQPHNQGCDLIQIVEDTDGDGVADRVTRFADELSVPTAILPFQNGCIVQNGTETLYLADSDGDGIADRRKILISGWALGDTHGGVSNFRLGLDNWIYAMQGYNNSTPEIEGQKQQTFRMGFWRFKFDPGDENQEPRVTQLEFLRSTDNNTWGLGISEDGLIFGSTANRNPSCFLPVPNRYYERVRGWSPSVLRSIADTYMFEPVSDKVRQVDQHGGYTAGAGHALYTARAYPQTWWNRTAFVCGPTGKLVGTFVLIPDGAGFRSMSPANLVASDDEWTAPIVADVGPDGFVWILDWYNYIVQHNPTPHGFKNGKGNAYETVLRDKILGRIYRLAYLGKDAGPSDNVNLADADPEALVQHLRHPSMIVRLNAQRLLVEQGLGKQVVPDLLKLVQNDSQDEIGLNVGAIHAIWTLHGINAIAQDEAVREVVVSALRHDSAGVRRNAIQALPPGTETVEILLANKLLGDEDPQVKLAAILALADQPENAQAGAALARLSRLPSVTGDRWLNDALTSAAAVHTMPFLQSLAATGEIGEPAERIVAILGEHIARGRPDWSQIEPLLVQLPVSNARFSQSLLAALKEAWPADHALKLEPAADARLLQMMENLPDAARGDLIWLGMNWGSESLQQYVDEMVAGLSQQLADTKATVEDRVLVARQLVGFRPEDPEIVTTLIEQLTPQATPEFATAIIEELSRSEAKNVGDQLIARVDTLSPSLQQVLLRALLVRPPTTRTLLVAVDEGRLRIADLTLDQKAALREHPDQGIRDLAREVLAKDGGLPNPDRQRVIHQLMPLTEKTGSVDAGLAVYKKQCAKCHQHGDLGENIGPNLTGMAVHPKAELLTHILDPSQSVEGNYRLYTVVLNDGRVINGTLASETRTSLELIDTEAKRYPIQREDIDELVATPKSLMPEGFEKQMSEVELVDLLEFLTHRGQFVPIDLRKYATVVSTKGMFYSEDSGVERMVFPDWKPKVFQGVPFLLVDPQGDQLPNAIMLKSPNGQIPPKMPESVTLSCQTAAKSIHLLSGVSGWGAQSVQEDGSVSMIVRLKYQDGVTEDHELRNGFHFADYIRRFDVPGSEFAFALRSQQLRYLAIYPKRTAIIDAIELVKGPDQTAPIVMAVTVESPEVQPEAE